MAPSISPTKSRSNLRHQGSEETPLRPVKLTERWAGAGLAAVLRLLSSTWRVDCVGAEILDELERLQRCHILAFWHRHYITLFRLFHDRSAVAVTNQSRRGRIIANICQRSGMPVAQISAAGADPILRSLEQATQLGWGLAMAVDGPLGPAGDVKRVVLRLASRLRCPIVPICVSSSRHHVIASRWDRLEIPYFLSHVSFAVGAPLGVPSMASRAELREIALQIKNAIDGRASQTR